MGRKRKAKVSAATMINGPSLFANAHNVQITGGNFTVVGRDVHNSVELQPAVWAALRSIPNFRKIYQDMLSRATPGTGLWLLRNKYFRVWLELTGDIKVFWGSGSPGAGKTVLASIAIQRLEALRKDCTEPICVCYFYFRYTDRAEITVRRVLEVLIKQTLERHPDCFEEVNKTYAQHHREETEPTEAQLLTLLRTLVDGMAATFFVLDALDEAPPGVQLAVIQTLASLGAKLFITSRPLPAVEVTLPDVHRVRITAQAQDLELHIVTAIGTSAGLQALIRLEGSSLETEIINTVKRASDGMFLHASLQMNALCECVSLYQVRQVLEGFPSKIEDVYHQTWARIEEQGQFTISLVISMLLWVVNAPRPMTLPELERAIAVSFETLRYDPNRVVPASMLLAACRGLIVVEEKSGLVRLVHYTAEEPLKQLVRDAFPEPHPLLSGICITYLTERNFQNSTIDSEEDFKTVLQDDPLLAYASEAWVGHTRQSMRSDESRSRASSFVAGSTAFPAFTSSDRTCSFDLLTPLHLVAINHLPPYLVGDAATKDPNVLTGLRCETPLILACRFRYRSFVVLLLALPGIDVNLVDGDGVSALASAAQVGPVAVPLVELLIACPDIQVNLVNNNGSSALMVAATRGREDVVQLLFTRPEIQPNLVDRDGFSALAMSARKGFVGVVTILLTHPDIQVNLANNRDWTPLMEASRNVHTQIVALLLKRPDVDPNLVNQKGWSALIIAASRKGSEDIVRLLLGYRQIQVNLVTKQGWSALMHAACGADTSSVAALLECAEIDVNLQSFDSWTALILASARGRYETVRHLLSSRTIDANATNRRNETALWWAAVEGHEAIVRMLLRVHGIDVTIRDLRSGRTAAMIAMAKGHYGISDLIKDFESRDSALSPSIPDEVETRSGSEYRKSFTTPKI